MYRIFSSKNSRLRAIGSFLVLAAAAFGLYGNTLSNRFVFDDIPLVVENRAIKSPANIPLILGLKNGRPMYRPVRFLSYLIDYAFSGLSPTAYHVSNILYHAATAFVLYGLLMLLSGSAAAAITGALLFLAHPVHTDSVAYISGRRDILSTLFYLAGFYCFVRYRLSEKTAYLILTLAAFVLAVGAKEMAVTLPAVCLLYDIGWTYGGSRAGALRKTVLKRLGPYVALTIMGAASLYCNIGLHYPSLRTEFYGGSAINNFATVFRIIGRYIQLTFFPVVLHADYSYNAFPVSASFFEPGVLVWAALVAILVFLFAAAIKKNKLFFLGGLWFFVTLLPVCHIFPHHEIMAEHYLYLPSVGLMILAAPLWSNIFRWKKFVLVGSVAAILLVFSVRTVVRNRDWKDAMTLWANVLATTPACARANDNMGSGYFKRKDYEKALYHYRQAARLRPDHAIFRNNLGMALGATGDIEQAEAEFKKALSLNRGLAAAYNNLGIVHYKKRDYQKAGWFFWISAKKKPSAKAWFNSGKAAMKLGKPKEAARALTRAIDLRRDYVEAYNMLGIALQKSGRPQRAVNIFQQAVVLKPDYAEAYYNLGSTYFYELGDFDRALYAAQKCVSIDPGLKKAFSVMAGAHEKKGNFSAAVEAYRNALSRGPKDAEILYKIAVLYNQKMGDREKSLWYLERASKAARDPKLKERIQKALKLL